MDPIANDIVSQCANAASQIVQNAQSENLELAKKLLSMNMEIKMGLEQGKGEHLDIRA